MIMIMMMMMIIIIIIITPDDADVKASSFVQLLLSKDATP